MRLGVDEREVTLTPAGSGRDGAARFSARFDAGSAVPVEARLKGPHLVFQMGERRLRAHVVAGKGRTEEVFLRGEAFTLEVAQGAGRAGLAAAAFTGASIAVKTPMPGRVVALSVSPGDVVARGDLLVTLEAMKMQNEFHAPSAGRVSAVRVRAGQIAAAGDVLVEIAPADAAAGLGGKVP